MDLLGLKRSKSVADHVHFRIKKNDYGAKIRHTLKYGCEAVWQTLLANLRPGEPWGDLIVWQIGDPILVRPASSDCDELNRRFQPTATLQIQVRDYRQERRKHERLKDADESARQLAQLDKELSNAMAKAILQSFQLKSVQERYCAYNPDNRPFTIVMTPNDDGLQNSEWRIVWKNSKGFTAAALSKKTAAVRGKPLPKEARQPSSVEAHQAAWKAKQAKQQAKQKKVRAKAKREAQAERTRKAESKLPAQSHHLKPPIRFASAMLTARCKKAWRQMFAFLYEYSVTAERADILAWECDPGKRRIRCTPRSSRVLETRPPRKSAEVVFDIDMAGAFSGRSKKLDASRQAEWQVWIERAIVESFRSEDVQIDYSWFNQESHPFSIIMTGQDKGLLKGDWTWLFGDCGGLDPSAIQQRQQSLQDGSPRPSLRRSKKSTYPTWTSQPEPKPPKAVDNALAGSGWRRFYFDDGKRRLFHHLCAQASSLKQITGSLGEKGNTQSRKCASAAKAKAAMNERAVQLLHEGYREYRPEAVEYVGTNRRVKSKLPAAVRSYEKEHRRALPRELRTYLEDVNGGRPKPGMIHLPGHPMGRVNVGAILGFHTGQYVWDIPYNTTTHRLPAGHVPVASGEHLLTVDASGVIHFWDMSQLDRSDVDDDNTVHLERCEPVIAANSFDELLTRLANYSDDVVGNAAPKKAKRPAPSVDWEATLARQPLRRFFLDDGKSRKFWHIHTDDKSVETRYGRLGAAGSQTQKTFPSKEAAAAFAAKQIEQKSAKGYIEVAPGRLSLTRPDDLRSAREATIKAFEKRFELELPEAYRQFLKGANGGAPEPGFVELPGVPHIANVDVDRLYGLYPKVRPRESLEWAIEAHADVLPAGHLPIAAGADTFTLALKKHRGAVYFWDHETSQVDDDERFLPAAGHLMAHSFDEFLTRLAVFSG